jgi:hypothetical protein
MQPCSCHDERRPLEQLRRIAGKICHNEYEEGEVKVAKLEVAKDFIAETLRCS